MGATPTLRRFYRGECTRCGRKRDGDLWCTRCATTSRAHGQQHPPRGLHSLSPAELAQYLGALGQWARGEEAAA